MPTHPSRWKRLALALLTATLLTLGAAACGSDDDNGGGDARSETSAQEPLSTDDYLDEVNDAQREFAGDAAKLDLASPDSPKAFERSLDQLVGLIDTLTERLDEVEPPEDVTAQHDELVSQLTEYGDAIAERKGGLSSDDQQQVVKSATAIGKASTRFSQTFDDTIAEINEQLD